MALLENETQREMRKQNEANFEINAPIIAGRMQRSPLRKIYIHTVAKKPEDAIKSLFPKAHLKACENGERWVMSFVISDPIVQWSPDQERDGQRPDDHDGWRAAIDLLNGKHHH